MSQGQKEDGLISVFVDDVEVRCKPGTNLVDLVASVGGEIPHYCYHPKLSVSGNCRMCLIELGMPGTDRAIGEPMLNIDGSPKIMYFPNPAIACGTRASDGMHVRTKTDMVKRAREGVMEFLLINHPLDCPICDQAGECRLQEFSTEYGKGYSRFVEQKVVKPKRTVLGPRVMLDDERCVLCSRCIRFCQEVADDDVLGFVDRGSYSTLTCYPGKKLENNYSLNTVDICPVGALTSRDFRFKMRVWFLKESPSICTESSVGVNTLVASREGKIYRITPRRNDAVNDTWMADSGRVLYKEVADENRLTEFSVDVVHAKIHQCLKSEKAAFVGSGGSSLEELYLFNRLSRAIRSVGNYVVAHYQEGDGLLISNDAKPNTRGALSVGFIETLPENQLTELSNRIDAGEIDTVVVYNEDLLAAGISEEQLEKVELVYFGAHANATSAAASVVVPTLTVFEKDGTFINQQFRLQKFLGAVPGPSGVVDDLVTLSQLLNHLEPDIGKLGTVAAVWDALAEEISLFTSISFSSLSTEGVVLDGSAFEHLPFCEGKSLHYEPKAETVEADA
ncbi:MAG: ferredoxin [Opitutaceae bacterium]|nr:ferredoxin [Opitutaceae bacterium]|tara:strand:- start:5362 stop:7050 length:1689 start_codon:yes stop_codon:yes gene_type:complete